MCSLKTNIFIPTKVKVGYNLRSGCYTGKLAYVIYWKDNEWKQKKSWEDWIENYANVEKQQEIIDEYNKTVEFNISRGYTRDNIKIDNFNDVPSYYRRKLYDDITLEPKEYNNEPLEGYVLNKKVGGYDTGWNHRQTYCRVYDPRGFEFEITIENLLYILENTNSIVGKGLEGKFILGWVDKKIVLIPEKSPDYKQMMNFTNVQSNKLSAKELVDGYVYVNKTLLKKVYLGKHIEYEKYHYKNHDYTKNKTKKYFWYDIKSDSIETTSGLTSFSHKESDEIYDDYSTVYEKLLSSPLYSPYDDANFIYERDDEKGKLIKYNGNYSTYWHTMNKDSKTYDELNVIGNETISIYDNNSRIINVPRNTNAYNYVINQLGGFFIQRKFLKNGKEVK